MPKELPEVQELFDVIAECRHLEVAAKAKESYQNFLAYGFSRQMILPRIFIGAHVNLHILLDLTSRSVLKRLGFTTGDLISEDWRAIQSSGEESWTQAIGRGCFLAGFEGMLVHSAHNAPKGRNLVYFPENLKKISSVELLGKDQLPKHPG